jgi:2-oxoglutarate ferredoxin oxidoreductase subunit gamma
MERATVFAGFGGQGILFAAEALARAALLEGREVLWIPSYGPEMRGGTASCSVIVADGQIGSPVVDVPDIAVVLNPPSLARFEPMVAPGGVLVVNDSLIEAEARRHDITVVRVRCTAEARKAGSEQMTAVVALGAVVAASGIVSAASVREALAQLVAKKHPETMAGNLAALQAGFDAAAPTVTSAGLPDGELLGIL